MAKFFEWKIKKELEGLQELPGSFRWLKVRLAWSVNSFAVAHVSCALRCGYRLIDCIRITEVAARTTRAAQN
jgi:hypothetical protein